MADTYTTSLRFQMQAYNGNSNTWGAIADTQYQMIEAAITGDNGYAGGAGGINIAGLATYTLTVAQGTADQSRQALYPFVGALAVDCAVSLPGVAKIGYAYNATTGGKNVILKVGAGTTITLAPGSGWTVFYCDGTNITAPPLMPNGATFNTGAGTTSNLLGSLEKFGIITQGGAGNQILTFAIPFPTAVDCYQVTPGPGMSAAFFVAVSTTGFNYYGNAAGQASWRVWGH